MKYELTEKKAAALLGVTEGRVSQLVKDGSLDHVTIRGCVRISKESVAQYQNDGKQRRGRPPRSSYPTAVACTLMNANYEIAEGLFDAEADSPLSLSAVADKTRAPLGILTRSGNPKKRELNDWWLHRSIPGSRPGLEKRLLELGIGSPSGLAARSMGLSLSDCYWLRPADSPHLKWEDVNYFDNDFAESNAENWDDWLSGVGLSSPDNTSEGELPKKWVIADDKTRYLLKGCRTDDQRPYNEAVATALHRRLLNPGDFVAYSTMLTADGPASSCANFLKTKEEYIPAIYIKNAAGNMRGTSAYDRFCRTAASLGANESATRTMLSKMILCDALLANSDRHWRNFGFVRNVDTLELWPAPLFDTGNCLWYAKSAREIANSDWAFAVRPFAFDVHDQLACIDDLTWFNPNALEGFADEACEILSASSHATAPKRLEFIKKGIESNIALVTDAAKVLSARIAREK